MSPYVSVAGGSREDQGLLPSALAAAELGWHVFPCAPGSKRPALKGNWQDIATTDLDRVRSWWARQAYNIGIACGPSGLVVVDLDIGAGGLRPGRSSGPGDGPLNGVASLELLCRAHGQRYPAGTYTVDTPSGGCHLYFTAPSTPVRNSAGRLGPLIDIRADGGYVVGAGSRIGGRAYAIRGDFLPLTLPLPGWMARLLAGEALAGGDSLAGGSTAPPRPLPLLDGAQARAYAMAALREETRRVAAALPGTRNDTLNRAAFSLGQLVAASLLPPLPVMTALADAAACAGLPEDEARRTIRSGMAAGTRKPRPQESRQYTA
jgi:hypothetical protein